MIINAPNLSVLRRTFNKTFQGAYDAAESWAGKVATRVAAPTGINIYGWLGGGATIRRWRGERRMQAIREADYIVRSEKYEGTVKVDRDMVRRDSLGIYDADFHGLGRAAKTHPDLLLARMLRRGTRLSYDGLSMFNVAHLTYNVAVPTYSNDFTLDLSSGIITDGASSPATATLDTTGGPEMLVARALAWVRERMAVIPIENSNPTTDSAASSHDDDEDGDVLGVNMNQVLTPIGWELAVRAGIGSSLLPTPGGASLDNSPYRGIFTDVVVGPQLSGNTIYLFDTSKPVKALIHQVTSNPIVKSFDGADEYIVFLHGDLVYGIDGDDGGSFSETVAPSHPFLSARLNIVP